MQPTAVIVAGALDIGFAVFHAMFWWLFGWPERLQASGPLNAAITQTLNSVLIFVFAVYGSALLGFAVAGEPAPRLLAMAGAGFWTLRFLLQPLVFRIWSWPMTILTITFLAAAIAHGLAAASVAPGPLPLD